MITAYAAWCRRQAGTLNCGHAAAPGLVLLGVAAWGLVVTIERYQLVIEHAALAVAGTLTAAAVTWAVLAAGQARHRRWLRTRCADCRMARAIAQVTYANGHRSGTVATCGPCWKRAERLAAAAAHDGTVPGWECDSSGPGLPRITEEPALAIARTAPEPVAAVPASPDNAAASGPLPPELMAYEQPAPKIIPPEAWTRSHP